MENYSGDSKEVEDGENDDWVVGIELKIVLVFGMVLLKSLLWGNNMLLVVLLREEEEVEFREKGVECYGRNSCLGKIGWQRIFHYKF